MALRFAGVELDVEGMTLTRDGEAVAVEPQVFDVLVHLVTHRDRMVSRMELLDEVWGDRFVSDSALSSRIKSARRAIGDNGRDQRLIRTVHGRGFRFVGEVTGSGTGAGPDPASGPPMMTSSASANPTPIGDVLDLPAVDEEVLRRVTARDGDAVALIGVGAVTRATALDDLLRAAEDAGLLVGRGDAGAVSGDGLLDAIDEWVQRRPELLEHLPPTCRTEMESVLGGRDPTTPQRLRLCLTELAAAVDRSGGAVLALDDLHLAGHGTVELAALVARSARRRRVAVAVSQPPGVDVPSGFRAVVLDAGAGDDPIDRLSDALVEVLARVAVLGDTCTIAEFAAAAGLDADAAARASGTALAVGVFEEVDGSLRFTSAETRDRLRARLPAGSDASVHLAAAEALISTSAPAASIAVRLLAAGRLDDAAPHLVAAARTAAAGLLHQRVLELTERADEVSDAAVRAELLELRADALDAMGDPDAIRRYREALRVVPSERVNWLRARLGRAHLFLGDLDAASEVLDVVEPDGGEHDGAILLILATLDYFRGDLDAAERRVDQARPLALAPGAPEQLLDTIALQGLIAHSKGEWFDRLRRELRVTSTTPELVGTVFDSHVCVTQYLLYGPGGHDEALRVASELRATADQHGSDRAAGFATTLAGEARLLSGDLDGARRELTESVELHRRLGAETGLAHALQRLAEVALAQGERAEAEALARRALPMARWSPLSRHLLQRVYGTLIAAAPDAEAALAVRDEAVEVLDGPTACEFCQVMIDVPATVACAGGGRLDQARAHLADARRCAERWDGPAWPAAVDEATAALRRAEQDPRAALQLLRRAAEGYRRAGQVLDVARCEEAADELADEAALLDH